MKINKNSIIILFLCFLVLKNRALANVTNEKCLNKIECDEGLRCYNSSEICDKIPHCRDGSDEKNCETTCNDDEFDCGVDSEEEDPSEKDKFVSFKSRRCVHFSNLCDGFNHCTSGMDEMNCSFCATTHLNCGDSAKTCVPKYKICDQVADCPNGKDEMCEAKMNEKPRHPKQICDERPCQHICHSDPFNTQAFKCSCKPSFKLQPDQRTCVLEDEPRIMIMLKKPPVYGRNNKIKQMSEIMEIGSYSSKVLKKVVLFDIDFHAKSTVYDRKNNRLYLIDESLIYAYKMDDLSNPFLVINVSIHFEEPLILKHLSFDWVHENLYFCAKVDKSALPPNSSLIVQHQSVVAVVILDGNQYKIASLSPFLSEVSSMVVDPRASQRYIYFIGRFGQIQALYRCDLDGSNVLMLSNLPPSNDNIALTLDTYNDFIYWIESTTIKSYSFKAHQIKSFGEIKPSQEILAAFDETLFLRDNLEKKVIMKNFVKNSNIIVIYDNFTEETFEFISIIHPFVQPSEKDNACKNTNKKCSHICIPKNKKKGAKAGKINERDLLKCLCHLQPTAFPTQFILKHKSVCELENRPNETVFEDMSELMERFSNFEYADQINSDTIDLDSVMGYAAKKNQDYGSRTTTPLIYKLTITTISLVAIIVILIVSVHVVNYWHKRATVWAF